MSRQFKPGDLALTLIDLPPIMMAGSVVELETRLEKGDVVHTSTGPLVASGFGWICLHPLAPGKCAYADSALMPLRGDFSLEQQKVREIEPCA